MVRSATFSKDEFILRITIRNIFFDNENWARYCFLHKDELREVEIKEVEKMLRCHADGKGFFYAIQDGSRNSDAIYWPITMELYLSKDWFGNDQRIKAAAIPQDIAFRTKPEIALEHLKLIRKENVPHRAAIGDAGYGTVSRFRKEFRKLEEPYPLAVTPFNLSVVPEETRIILPGKKSAKGQP